MFHLIGGIFKYTFLVLTVLILSHVIEIKGVTISQHVLNAMHFVSGYGPRAQIDHITSDFTMTMQKRVNDLNKIDNEVTPEDQKALNHVIENSQSRR